MEGYGMRRNPVFYWNVAVFGFIALLVLISIGYGIFLQSNSNRQWLDTSYTFDSAIIALPDGKVVKGRVESWLDWDDNDMIQVRVDGRTYYVHGSNVALLAD